MDFTRINEFTDKARGMSDRELLEAIYVALHLGPAAPAIPPQTARATSTGGPVLPNYGRSKGQPVYGATMGDLEYYAGGCRRTLDDPGKSRWHEKERVLLAAIEEEIARQRGGGGPPADGGAPDGWTAPDGLPPDDGIPF